MQQDHTAVQGAKRHTQDSEEVDGGDLSDMILEKALPGL